jgi:uncharacterized protein YjbI with pentapeptide repeats
MVANDVFTEVAYQGQTFTDLVAEQSVFERIEFEECHFVGCRLSGSAFQGCAFVNCTFTLCDLGLLKAPSSRFAEAQFTDCKLIGVDWTDASSLTALTTSMGFLRCILSYSSFANLDVKGMRVIECEAHEVDFTNARLQRAVFTKTDLTGARFVESDLREADFVGARNYVIDPTRNKVKKARFALPEAVGLLVSFGVVVQPYE